MAALGLSCSTREHRYIIQDLSLWCTDSLVQCQLSWSKACGICLDQGLNPCPQHWQVDSYPLCHQGSPCSIS